MSYQAGSPPQPAAPPTRIEIERKLSMRSASPADAPRRRGASSTNIHSGSLSSTGVSAGYFPQSGNESDSSSYSPSNPQPGSYALPAASPVLGPNSLTGGILSAIAETGGLAEEGDLSEGFPDEHDGEDEASDDGEVGAGAGQVGPGGELEKGMQVERVIKSGYLMKNGERRKNWQKRWFVLRTDKLAYYKDDREYLICRILTLKEIHSIVPVQLKKHQNVFGIVTPKRTYYIRAEHKGEMDSWVEALQEAKRSWADVLAVRVGGGDRGTAAAPMVTPGGNAPAPTASSASTPLAIPTSSRSHSVFTEAPFLATGGAMQYGTTSSEVPLESPMGRLGLGISPSGVSSTSNADRSRPSDRAPPSRREPSNSSLSSAAGGLYGQPLRDNVAGDTTTPGEMGGVTSSEDEEDFAPNDNQALAGPGPSSSYGRPQQVMQTIQTDPNKVILSGYLMKKGMQRRTWRKRWFVLTSGALMYTASHMDSRVHRQVPLSDILDAMEIDGDRNPDSGDEDSVNLPPQARGQIRRGRTRDGREKHKTIEHGFQVITPKRTFRLCAPSEEDEIKWLAALQALINRERGLTSPSTGLPPPLPLLSSSISQQLGAPLSPRNLVDGHATGSYFPAPDIGTGEAAIHDGNRRLTELPPLVTVSLPRTRSATQSARSAIADAMKRFGDSSGTSAS